MLHQAHQEKEALSLILWRAYDCSVNCVQDACHLVHVIFCCSTVYNSGFVGHKHLFFLREDVDFVCCYRCVCRSSCLTLCSPFFMSLFIQVAGLFGWFVWYAFLGVLNWSLYVVGQWFLHTNVSGCTQYTIFAIGEPIVLKMRGGSRFQLLGSPLQNRLDVRWDKMSANWLTLWG